MKFNSALGLAIFFFLLFFTTEINAAHIIGGEMTYVCQGDDPNTPGNKLYLFTLTVYRDCDADGAGFDSSPGGGLHKGTITPFLGNEYFDWDNDGDPLNSIILDAPVVDTIDPADGITACVEIPTDVCTERGIYTFTVSLPVANDTYTISYQRCCRNAAITNIEFPGEAGSTYTVEITPFGQQECNSSPFFANVPPVVVCLNENLNFDHSAFDFDGDQLVYEFCSPLLGGSTSNVAPQPPQENPPPYNGVQFVLPNYSFSNPLGGQPQVTINPFSGLIAGVPDVQGTFVVGICVKEFRNGNLLSTVQRDYQFTVTFVSL